ncbi:conjugal transfer protein [Ensifer sp. Root31]|uniref:TrbI/VirB10 family protein n=1 Tax=Ensifer sp. Root31 TaxID=1736512 RepID=UPI00070A8FD5|nr:TrbI/VirB10 family protein [Ensifer sp. Root31]KQU85463.1 conjugal transfer protein [Ensifer sp. Root31]
MPDNEHSLDPLPREISDPHEESRRAAEREELLGARRARQSGQAGLRMSRLVPTLAVIAVALGVFVLAVGSTGSLRLLGIFGNDDARTSQVDMEVDREKTATTNLDFIVPAIPEPVKTEEDPSAAFNEKFKALQEKLAEMERNRQPGMSNSEIQRMLSSYNDAMARKLEEERKAMAEEAAKLRAAAEKAEEQRRQAEEAARLQAEQFKNSQEIDMKQRQSQAVIVDEGDGLAVGAPLPGENGFSGDLDQNERFLQAAASSSWQTSVSQRLRDPSRTVVQGTIIPAVLETAIDTQLPGSIRAQVTQPVYSFDGSRVLMPNGTILIGQFNNEVGLAQKRVLIAWNRAITPDGNSISLGSIGTDRLGRSGTLGNVDNRYATKFGAGILISAIGAVPTILSESLGKNSGSSGTTINIGGGGQSSGGAGAQLANDMGGELSDQTKGILEEYLSLPPVIRIPQGEEIRVFVNRDLILR